MGYQKNDIVTITIEDIGTKGEGIGKIDGYTLFVKDAILGDVVTARIMKSKKNYAYARLEEVITPSSFRVIPKCKVARQCGGCQLQAMSYEKQLEYKQLKVKNHLVRIGKFIEDDIVSIMEPIIGMDNPFHYRNKAQFPVGLNKEGKIITGFYAGRTHSIIENTYCWLGAKE
ncbi:MAG: TRAM domain-containing protein, partial [Eubacteriales bacterium]